MSTSNLKVIAANQKLCPECQDAENRSGLDIACVLKELASVRDNKKSLSPRDMCYLCLSFCGYDSKIIAYRLTENKMPENSKELENVKYVKKARNLKKDMSGRVHFWIKERMNLLDGEYKPSWSKIIHFFQEICCKREAKNQDFSSQKIHNDDFQKFMFLIEGDRSLEEINRVLKEAGINVKIKRLVNIEEET